MDLIEKCIIGLIVFIIIFIILYAVYEKRCSYELEKNGYYLADIRTFHNATDISVCDILESPNLRNHLDLFISGETSKLIEQSKVKKNINDVESTAITYGIVGGMVAGSVMR